MRRRQQQVEGEEERVEPLFTAEADVDRAGQRLNGFRSNQQDGNLGPHRAQRLRDIERSEGRWWLIKYHGVNAPVDEQVRNCLDGSFRAEKLATVASEAASDATARRVIAETENGVLRHRLVRVNPGARSGTRRRRKIYKDLHTPYKPSCRVEV